MRNYLQRFWLSAMVALLSLCHSYANVAGSFAYENHKSIKKVRLSMRLHNVSLEEALWAIENRTDFKFIYSSNNVDKDELVNINVIDESVDKILTLIFTGKNLIIKQRNNEIFLKGFEKKVKKASPRGAAQGRIRGVVTDVTTGEYLPGASVFIEDSGVGVITDLEGRFSISNAPEGDQVLVVRFLGYVTARINVRLTAGEVVERNVQLEPDIASLQEVVITDQALGQMAAINQQVNSNTIVNVVSKDKIESLPDQNAAESIGRLPGIAIQRDGGEGQKVVVRGLSPRFNAITINGERIPSTDPQDRSVDLTFIAPEQLAGIEVFKALTPDRDADAVGGSVNFIARKASRELEGQIRASTGYNDLEEEYGQSRFNGSLSNRFFDNKFGVLGTANFQRASRSADVLDADYDNFRSAESNDPTSITLSDLDEVRRRYGASLTLDYEFNSESSIVLNSLWGETDRDEVRRRRIFDLVGNRERFQIRERDLRIRAISNTVSGEHPVFKSWRINWRGSYSLTRQQNPDQTELRFRILDAFDFDETPNLFDLSVFEIPTRLQSNVSQAFVDKGNARTIGELTKEDAMTAQVDFRKDFKMGLQGSGYIKFGGKVRRFDRSNEITQRRDIGNGNLDELNGFVQDFPDEYDLNSAGRILMSNFLTGESSRSFLEGDVDFGPFLNLTETRRFFQLFGDEFLVEREVLESGVSNANYEAEELISAGYVMSEINMGKFMLMGGVRVERTDGNYIGFEALSVSDDDVEEGEDPVVTIIRRDNDIDYTELLPMFHVRYKPTDWFDVRAAVTKSLSRPNFQNLVPWQNFNTSENTIRRGNPNLRPTIAWNYDLFFSFYNKAGLFTVGLFYKELENIDVLSRSVNPPIGVDFAGADVEEPINVEGISTVTGIEVEFQTNFRWLPSPWDGILFSANVTLLDSETFYPVFSREGTDGSPLFTPSFLNTERPGAIPGQPDLTANIALGYEKGGFSGRVSVILQDQSFDELGTQELKDTFTNFSTRWDATVKQDISKRFQVFLNWNNITNEPQRSFQADMDDETEREFFGATVDLGLRYKLF